MASSLKAASPDEPSHMVVNLLSAEQASVAVKFSRADLHPEPFLSVPFTLSEEGIPVLKGSLGAISCKLVSAAVPLHNLGSVGRVVPGKEDALDAGKPVVSELFIAQVMRVEALDMGDVDEEHPRTLPLLYHRRGYTSCHLPKSK
jgi:flavin reductase (DIM6/NTAB) family NADH-FMN oxidoreductase RutF